MDQELAERARKELGEGVDLAYIELILEMNAHDLMVWTLGQFGGGQRPGVETIVGYRNGQCGGALLFGTKIIRSDLRCMLFILGEITSRIEARKR